jgi:hypothetical protein
LTDNQKNTNELFKVYVRPQTMSEYCIVTMDPKEPFKICLYPPVKDGPDPFQNPIDNTPDELDELILHNYLVLKRDLFRN